MLEGPKVYKDKLVTKYSDTESAMIHDYVQKSYSRVSKVRAGASLLDTIEYKPAAADRSKGVKFHQNIEGKDNQGPIKISVFRGLSSQHSLSEIPGEVEMSEFMTRYLNAKTFDQELVEERENHLFSYFREKYGLMSKFLGDTVLKGFLKNKVIPKKSLQPKLQQSNSEGLSPHKGDKELSNLIHPSNLPPVKGVFDRCIEINRGIIEQIIREEHQANVDKLNAIQIEQNMELFNALEADKLGNDDPTKSIIVYKRVERPKLFLKKNFIRQPVDPDDSNKSQDRSEAPIIHQDKVIEHPRPVTQSMIKIKPPTPEVFAQVINAIESHKVGAPLNKSVSKSINKSMNKSIFTTKKDSVENSTLSFKKDPSPPKSNSHFFKESLRPTTTAAKLSDLRSASESAILMNATTLSTKIGTKPSSEIKEQMPHFSCLRRISAESSKTKSNKSPENRKSADLSPSLQRSPQKPQFEPDLELKLTSTKLNIEGKIRKPEYEGKKRKLAPIESQITAPTISSSQKSTLKIILPDDITKKVKPAIPSPRRQNFYTRYAMTRKIKANEKSLQTDGANFIRNPSTPALQSSKIIKIEAHPHILNLQIHASPSPRIRKDELLRNIHSVKQGKIWYNSTQS